jgi:hypothetical protein
MDRITFYRNRQTISVQLAELTWQEDLETMLRDLAKQYDEMAANVESDAENGNPKHNQCSHSGEV